MRTGRRDREATVHGYVYHQAEARGQQGVRVVSERGAREEADRPWRMACGTVLSESEVRVAPFRVLGPNRLAVMYPRAQSAITCASCRSAIEQQIAALGGPDRADRVSAHAERIARANLIADKPEWVAPAPPPPEPRSKGPRPDRCSQCGCGLHGPREGEAGRPRTVCRKPRCQKAHRRALYRKNLAETAEIRRAAAGRVAS